MISAKEALELPRARLSDRELASFQQLEALVIAAIRDSFTGLPFFIPVGIEQASVRVLYAVKRRFEGVSPEGESYGWLVQIAPGHDEATGLVIAHRLEFTPAPPAPAPPSKKGKKKDDDNEKPVPVLTQMLAELSALHGIGSSTVTLSPTPVLSILLGSYNRLDNLKAAVASFRKSAGTLSYEICVCDGGSIDGSREWLASQRDVVLVGDRHLTGAVVAFNHAFRISRGLFVANMNDDCEVQGAALSEGVAYLQSHPKVGQVAFAFKGDGEQWTINDIYPRKDYPQVTWPTTYANFGIMRREVADTVAAIQGGFWNPIYKTYAADCETSAWVQKLGHEVTKLDHLRVIDVRTEDSLRDKNVKDSGLEAKRMYSRWPSDAFRPNGADPRVSSEELERFRKAKNGTLLPGAPKPPDEVTDYATLIGWSSPEAERKLRALAPKLRALDPIGGFPKRAATIVGGERVLHVHMGTDADPQDGLVRALRKMGGLGYSQIRWPDFEHDKLQRRILEEAALLRPSFVFMQLQTPGAVDVDTIAQLRKVVDDPKLVIATWCGDIASENNPFNVDWQTPLARVVDLTLHSSLSHVHALRASGVHNSSYLNIGVDTEQYCEKAAPAGNMLYDVSFLGSRYVNDDFSRSLKWHDSQMRDEVVEKMKTEFGERFGLFGSGWDNGGKKVALAKAHEIYQQSHIGLSISLMNDLECYSSDRVFRILGCGALLLVRRFVGMEVLGLVHGETCLIWDTPDEAVIQAHNYLTCLEANVAGAGGEINGKPPLAIAEAGATLARSHHTWDVRVMEMQPYLDAVRGT